MSDDRPDGHATVEVRGASFRVDPSASRFGIWGPMADGSWEPETVEAVAALAAPGARVVDIGAWVGPVTLLAAALGAEVRCYEPDPVARGELEANLAGNDFADRVEVVGAALGTAAGRLELRSGELGDSMSSLVRSATGGASTTVEVRDVVAEAAAGDLASATLVKMDVEGLEFDLVPVLVPALGPTPPDLLLSTHGYPAAERARGWLPAPLRRVAPVARVWGVLARVVLGPLLLVGPQVRLARSLRVYPHRFVAERNGGRWRPLRRTDLVRQLVAPPRSAEFWCSTTDRLAAPPATGRPA